jgi:hypothetical protein
MRYHALDRPCPDRTPDPGRLYSLRSFEPAGGPAGDMPDLLAGHWVEDDRRAIRRTLDDGLPREAPIAWVFGD